MAAETGFLIDGTIYEVPAVDSFNMDEAQVLYDYAGLTIEDFVASPDETPEEAEARERRYDNPGFMRALMHITYQRSHPDVKPVTVKRLIGQANIIDAYSGLASADEDGEQEIPPASTTEPGQPSGNGSVDSSTSSGHGSTNGSDRQDSQPPRIGTGRSDTSSPEPTRATWAS